MLVCLILVVVVILVRTELDIHGFLYVIVTVCFLKLSLT